MAAFPLPPPSLSSSASPLPSTAPSDPELLRSLLRLSRDLAAPSSVPAPLLPLSSSLARKSNLISLLFEDLLFDEDRDNGGWRLPRSASLCFREIMLVLQRFKVLLADCSARSRARLLIQAEAVANDFHELTLELSTLLDILPLQDLPLHPDVRDLVALVRRQCRRSSPGVDPAEDALRLDVLALIADLEREIVPDRARLAAIVRRLGLNDSQCCRDEIDAIEREIGDRAAEKWTTAMVALVGLLRYAKCVLFGASTPRSETTKLSPFSTAATGAAADLANVPADFRCPISLELMSDPVVVATGQTYDRESISRWIGSGHATCPKSGQALAQLELVPNRTLKSLIAQWCRENNVPFAQGSLASKNEASANVAANKAALEAARMTASFLVEKLASSTSTDAANRVVHEIRQLAKSGSDSRAFVAEAGAIPLLLPLLWSEDAGLQVNAVTALLNLSILEANKKRIVHVEGGVDGVVHVLTNGATWRAKENAAATILSLSSIHSYRRKLGRHPLLVEHLVRLVRTGPASTKKDAMAAILSLASDRENIAKLVEGEVVEAALETISVAEVAEESVAVLAAVAKRGGAAAVWTAEGSVARLAWILRRGSEWARESAAAALVVICRRIGAEPVAELVAVPGIEWLIWELMGAGTDRARRKAASLGRICRRWAVAMEVDRTAPAPTVAAPTTTTVV